MGDVYPFLPTKPWRESIGLVARLIWWHGAKAAAILLRHSRGDQPGWQRFSRGPAKVDSITQAVLGATIAEAGFRKRLGGGAVAFGAVCGALPDLDMTLRFIDEWAVLVHHRGFSHSLLLLSLVAPLAGWLGYRVTGRSLGGWIHLALWALLTHPLLDVCTTYGTQLLWPVTTKRFAIDAVAVIDPFYTLPLFVAVLVGRFRRIPASTSSRLATFALALTTGYLALGFVQSRRGIALGSAELQGLEFPAVEIRATPTLANIWLWRIVARGEDGNLRTGFVSTWSPKRIKFESLDRPDDPLVAAALQSRRGRVFTWFAMDMVSARVERHANGAIVYLHDQRYGPVTHPREGLFGVAARFDAVGRLLGVHQTPPRRDFDLAGELMASWRLIRGRESE